MRFGSFFRNVNYQTWNYVKTNIVYLLWNSQQMTSQAANILKQEWNPYEATWIAARNIQQTLLQVYTQTQQADYVLMVVTF